MAWVHCRWLNCAHCGTREIGIAYWWYCICLSQRFPWNAVNKLKVTESFLNTTLMQFSPYISQIRTPPNLPNRCFHIRTRCRACRSYYFFWTSLCIEAQFRPEIDCLVHLLLVHKFYSWEGQTHRTTCATAASWPLPTNFAIAFTKR